MANIAIPDAAAEFVGSLKSVSKADWFEAEEYLGEGQEAIKEAVQRVSDALLAIPDRGRTFDDNLALASQAVIKAGVPFDAADLVVKFAIMAICAADAISEADYNTLVKPMRQAWATVPAWADLQQ